LNSVQNMLLTTAFFTKSKTTQLSKHHIGIFLHMDAKSFKALLDKVSPTIARQYTVMSRAVQPEPDRLAVNLAIFKYFATGSARILMYNYDVSYYVIGIC